VCDGPVDAIWIENLNTVLDDNKILTLANGERIPMTENCKLVFEVETLDNASPATVSRCGIVYVSATDLGYEPVIKSWVMSRKTDMNRGEEYEKLNNLFNKYIFNMRIFETCQKVIKQTTMRMSDIIRVT
jgi:dynein heavy chain